jgi:exosortase
LLKGEGELRTIEPNAGAVSQNKVGAETTQAWLHAGVVALVFLVILSVLYKVIVPDLVWQWWDDSNYSHGFLVPIFSGFIVWQRRKILATLTPVESWAGLPVLVAGVLMLILGDIGSELFLMRSSLIVIATGLILFHLGPEILRVLALPLAFLFFMVPLPSVLFYAIAFPLQSLAARNAAAALDLLAVPVLLDGNVIHLSQITLGVTEACSGIRSLISLLALAVAWAYLTVPGAGAKAAFIASTIPITIVSNAGRIVITGLAGQWLGVKYASGIYHTFSGYLIFLFALAGLLAVDRLIRVARRIRSRRSG